VSQLPIFYETRTVGQIDIGPEGPAFAYDPAWLTTRGAFPISVLMPLTKPRVAPDVFLPWAANLLPEASQLRTVGLRLGAAPEDVIGILAEIGRDTAGALSIAKPGHSGTGGWHPIPDAKALQRILDELPSKPFLVGDDGVSMSLAGVQTKLGVAIDADGRLCVPVEGAPSTYILKPDSDTLFGGVQNEALCLRLAKAVGLNAPDVTTGKAGNRAYLLVTRYDRIRQGERWRRLHQEDFCQALGKPPAAKYESNQSGIPGPTLAQMFALTRRIMRAPDVLALLDYVIFNVLACNTDAHAKNYGLLLSAGGRYRLAPLYDIASWLPYSRDHRKDRLAMSVDGTYHIDRIQPRHWEAQARKSDYDPDRALAHIRDLIARIPGEARHLLAECKKEGLATADLSKLVRLLVERCTTLAARYGSELMGSDQASIPGV